MGDKMKTSFVFHIMIASIILFFVGIFYQTLLQLRFDIHEETHNQSQQIFKAFYELKNLELEFYYEKNDEYIEKIKQFKEEKEALLYTDYSMKFLLIKVYYPLEKIEILQAYQNLLLEYHQLLEHIISDTIKLGLTHNEGLYGSLRRDAHTVENIAKKYQDETLMVHLLMMRRHEKDYMLRGLNEYVEKFKAKAIETTHYIETSYATDRLPLEKSLLNYVKNFEAFVALSNRIGETNHLGLRADAKQIRIHFENLDKVTTQTYIKVIESIQKTIFWIKILNVINLLVLIFLVYLIKKEMIYHQEKNPLTGMNGNTKIKRKLQELLKYNDERVIAYFDFDNFKSFNDKFGFKIGDEAIEYFALILNQTLHDKRFFLGHIGGDDFIMISKNASFEICLEKIEESINKLKLFGEKYYTQQEREKGFIFQKDRYGIERQMPLLGVSVAIVHLQKETKIESIDTLSAYISELKLKSKENGIAIQHL